MKTLIAHFIIILNFAGIIQAANIPISGLPVATSAGAGDDLLLNATNGGLGTWTSKRINAGNFVKSAAVSNSFIAPTNGYSTGLSINSSSITSSALLHTNVINPAAFTASYTNGNNWLAINGTTAQFTNILLFSFIRNGAEEYLVVGITNANKTLAVWPNVTSSQTAVKVTLGNPSLALYDNLPRQVGALFDGGGYGVTGYSISNKGVIAFGEGIDTTIVRMLSDTANYYSISVGVGFGGGHQNQFQIQSGSLFNDFIIYANDNIGLRGFLTNSVTAGGNTGSLNPFISPQILATNFTAAINPSGIASGLTCVGTNQNDYVIASGTLNPKIQVLDSITITGQGNFLVTGITNTGNIIALYPVLGGTFTTGAAIQVQKPLFVATNTVLSQGTVAGILASGSYGFVGTSVGNSQFPYGAFFADGYNTTTMGNTSTGDFVITHGIPHGGIQSQFTLQTGAAFNSFIIYANSVAGVREMTNSVGGNLPFDNGITIKGDIISSTAGNGLQIKSGSNAKIGTATANGVTAVTVATSVVTANSLIFLTEQTPAGTPNAPYVSSVTPGTGFQFKSTALDTSTVGWMIVEKN